MAPGALAAALQQQQQQQQQQQGSVPVQDGETSSRSSDGRSQSLSTTRKLLARLRRQLGDEDGDLLPALRWLRWAGLGVTLLTIALTIIVVVISNMKYHEYSTNLVVAGQAATLLEAGLRMGQALREMVIVNLGWSSGGAADVSGLHAELLSQTARFNTLLDTLYGYAMQTDRASLYTTVDTITTLFASNPLTGALETSQHTVSLHEACLEYISESKAAAALPAASLTAAIPSVAYVLHTSLRGSPIHSALNESMFAWARNSASSKTSVFSMLTAVYAGMSALLLLLALGVFLPVLLFVDASKDQVVRHFTALPRLVLDRLREASETQLRKLTQDDEDEEGAGDDGSDAEAEGEGAEQREHNERDGTGDESESGELTASSPRPDRRSGAPGRRVASGYLSNSDLDEAGEGPDARSPAGRVSSHGGGGGVRFQQQEQQAGGASRGNAPEREGPARAARPGADPADSEIEQDIWDTLFGATGGKPQAVSLGRRGGATVVPSSNLARSNGGRASVPSTISRGEDPGARGTFTSAKHGSTSDRPQPPSAPPSTTAKSSQPLTVKSRRMIPAAKWAGSQASFGGSMRQLVQGHGKGPQLEGGQRYSKSARPLLILLLRYEAPLLLLFVFFSVLYFTATSVLTSTLTTSSIALAANTRGVLIMDVASQLRKLVRSVGDPDAVQPLVLATALAASDLDYVHRLLTFGGVPTSEDLAGAATAATTGSSLLSAEQVSRLAAITYSHACTALWQYDTEAFPTAPVVGVEAALLLPDGSAPVDYSGTGAAIGANLTVCMGLMSGVLAHGGLHAGIRELIRTTAGYVVRRAAANVPLTSALSGLGNMTTLAASGAFALDLTSAAALSTSPLPPWNSTAELYSVPEELSAAGMRDIREAGFRFLPRASFLAATQYAAAGQATIANFATFQIIFSAAFLSAYLLFLLFVYLPSIRRENAEIRKQRAILLLLPPPVFRFSRELRALLVGIINGGADGSRKAARSSGRGGGSDNDSGSIGSGRSSSHRASGAVGLTHGDGGSVSDLGGGMGGLHSQSSWTLK